MSDPVNAEALAALLDQVAALREQVSPPLDPVRLRYAEALASRLHNAPPAVQSVLQAKLQEALKPMGRSGEKTPDAAQEETHEPTALAPVLRKSKPKALPEQAAPRSLLGQLNQHIHIASQKAAAEMPQPAGSATPDLKSAIRFRETWARISAETEVDNAAHRAPENAGPLNAHSLVLRTLALMRELSPDYLRRFMGHTESLLWLDQAYGQLKQPKRGAASKRPSTK